MLNRSKRLGQSFFDKIFPTSEGRVDPRTGKLVQSISFRPVTPWEAHEREIQETEQKLRALKARGGGGVSPAGDGIEEFASSLSRMRPDFAGQMNGRLSGYELSEGPGILENPLTWIVVGAGLLVALEATGVINLSNKA